MSGRHTETGAGCRWRESHGGLQAVSGRLTTGTVLRRRRKAQAEEVTGEMTDELKAELQSVPGGDSIARLQEHIETVQAEADSIVCGNTRVVEEHKCVTLFLTLTQTCA